MKRKSSLKDIAEKVGVSTALVSYVLNNKNEGRISKQVAEKIRAAAQELNYRVNHIARSLKTKKTFTIGLVVANISNSFYSTFARIIEDEAEKRNYTVLFGSSYESTDKLDRLINILLNQQVDGLIIAACEGSEKQIQYLQQHDVPFVLIDRYFPDIKCSYVAIDNYKAANEAVKHLAEQGNERIGFISYDTTMHHLLERKRGYIDGIKKSKLGFKKRWIEELTINYNRKELECAIDRLLSLPKPIDAIIFSANNLSIDGLKYINTLQLKVPEDLAIASFDESDAADLFYAPLTHIRQPLHEMARAATELLLESIGSNNKTVQVNMEAPLIIGKSSKARTVTDATGILHLH